MTRQTDSATRRNKERNTETAFLLFTFAAYHVIALGGVLL